MRLHSSGKNATGMYRALFQHVLSRASWHGRVFFLWVIFTLITQAGVCWSLHCKATLFPFVLVNILRESVWVYSNPVNTSWISFHLKEQTLAYFLSKLLYKGACTVYSVWGFPFFMLNICHSFPHFLYSCVVLHYEYKTIYSSTFPHMGT